MTQRFRTRFLSAEDVAARKHAVLRRRRKMPWLLWAGVLLGVFVTLLLASCRPPPPLPLDQQLPVTAAEQAFRELGYEPGNALANFRVYWATDAREFRQICDSPPELIASCSSQATTLGGRGYPRAVLAPGQPLYEEKSGCSVVSHEAIHWLIAKLRLAPHTYWEMGDHSDGRFFNPNLSGSAENLACIWLRTQRVK